MHGSAKNAFCRTCAAPRIAALITAAVARLAYARPATACGRETLDTHFVFMNADFVLADGSLSTCEADMRESKESWLSVLRDLKARGLKLPRLTVADGHLSISSTCNAEPFRDTQCSQYQRGVMLLQQQTELVGRNCL